MSADFAAHIFEPFFTTKPAGQGNGLGLTTVQGIVTGADGGISVFSEVGAGTTVRLLFPATGKAASARRAADIAGVRGNRQTILIVNDEPPVLEFTSRILRQNGYATLEAGTFSEALSLASSQDFELLLTDAVMPHTTGPALAERIAKLRPGHSVLYMSGHGADVPIPRGILDEGPEYIQKPFTRRTLMAKVEAARHEYSPQVRKHTVMVTSQIPPPHHARRPSRQLNAPGGCGDTTSCGAQSWRGRECLRDHGQTPAGFGRR